MERSRMERVEEPNVCRKCGFDQCQPQDRYCIKCGACIRTSADARQSRTDNQLLEASDVLFKLGEICYRKGERTQAAAYWKKVLELRPDHESARDMLDKIGAELVRRD
jgi:hypothetical protein